MPSFGATFPAAAEPSCGPVGARRWSSMTDTIGSRRSGRARSWTQINSYKSYQQSFALRGGQRDVDVEGDGAPRVGLLAARRLGRHHLRELVGGADRLLARGLRRLARRGGALRAAAGAGRRRGRGRGRTSISTWRQSRALVASLARLCTRHSIVTCRRSACCQWARDRRPAAAGRSARTRLPLRTTTQPEVSAAPPASASP